MPAHMRLQIGRETVVMQYNDADTDVSPRHGSYTTFNDLIYRPRNSVDRLTDRTRNDLKSVEGP